MREREREREYNEAHITTDVAVELFGSSVTQFALNSSNVNLNLNVRDPETNQVKHTFLVSNQK